MKSFDKNESLQNHCTALTTAHIEPLKPRGGSKTGLRYHMLRCLFWTEFCAAMGIGEVESKASIDMPV